MTIETSNLLESMKNQSYNMKLENSDKEYERINTNDTNRITIHEHDHYQFVQSIQKLIQESPIDIRNITNKIEEMNLEEINEIDPIIDNINTLNINDEHINKYILPVYLQDILSKENDTTSDSDMEAEVQLGAIVEPYIVPEYLKNLIDESDLKFKKYFPDFKFNISNSESENEDESELPIQIIGDVVDIQVDNMSNI